MGDANSTNPVARLLGSKRDRFIDFQAGGGLGTGFYADKHVNALLTAMQTKDYGRILAKPKILVNDNQTGVISTTDTTYVAKRSSVPVSTGTAGQQTTLIETAVSFEAYPAGIQLDITPHISKGDLLQLVIVLTRSDFGTITGEKPPDTTESNITTTVTVPDGSTIILGGMLKLNQSKGGSKVPILGDIPLVGALFRSVSNSDLQRNLYVFVKAEIIRPAETLAQGLPELGKISDRNRMAFEKFEQEFQSYQDFPGIKPKPVEPVKVLDAQ
jgi:general secretion pathway protein D